MLQYFMTIYLYFKLKDLLKFLFIAVFVIFGVGIYYHAILWPDHRSFWDGNWQNWRIWTIASLPYWQLYGDPNLDSLDGKTQHDIVIKALS